MPRRRPKPFSFPLMCQGGAAICLPSASGNVIGYSFGEFENLVVIVKGLPPDTAFDLFSIQVPTPPLGHAWHIGDIVTDERGLRAGKFTGRFIVETFIVFPGAAPPRNSSPSLPFPMPQRPDARASCRHTGPEYRLVPGTEWPLVLFEIICWSAFLPVRRKRPQEAERARWLFPPFRYDRP